jgi:cysteine synthase
LSDEDARKGVVTHSSGNHGQALALAARMRGIPAYIVMPSNAPQVKVDAVRGYGGNVVFCEPNLQAREDTAARVIQGITHLQQNIRTHAQASNSRVRDRSSCRDWRNVYSSVQRLSRDCRAR